MSIIYKILIPQEWADFQKKGTFLGSSMDLKDGFIHCALEAQFPIVKEKFFKDLSPLILLAIDSEKLPEGALKIEANRPGGDEYPHLYSPLSLEAVISNTILK